MKEEIFYMVGIIGVGFLVNYALRALPFLLFSGRNRELPPWVDRLGKVISPIIIGCLIVYSYSGSAWRTPWPYLAGVVTVALQVWRRNPLVSIVAGTAVYMLLVNCCGCMTQRRVVEIDGTNPELRMTADGVYFGDERVAPAEIIVTLEDAGISRERAIHIRWEGNMGDLRAPSALMALLAKGGYTRSTIVTEQHGTSDNKTVRLTTAGFLVGSRSVRIERIPAELERIKVPKDKLLQLVVDQDVRDDTPAQALVRLLKQSGFRFVDIVRASTQDAYLFYVTESGVTYGRLQPVGPDEVAQCLRRDSAAPDSPVRLLGYEQDAASENVQQIMRNLEGILSKAGYVNVKRFWLKPGQQAVAKPAGRTAAPRKGGIRYKKANE